MTELVTHFDIERTIDQLVESTYEAELRLEAMGERDAHDWMFALREVLLDLRRLLPVIASLPSTPDSGTAQKQMRDLAAELVYGFAPHVSHHLGEVLDLMDSRDADGPDA